MGMRGLQAHPSLALRLHPQFFASWFRLLSQPPNTHIQCLLIFVLLMQHHCNSAQCQRVTTVTLDHYYSIDATESNRRYLLQLTQLNANYAFNQFQ